MKKYTGSQLTKTGARNFARKFYSSKSWTKKSIAYRQEHPLCERCLKRGLYVPSTCVHHKEHINYENQNDLMILFGDDNLEALCDDCHAREHSDSKGFEFSEDGILLDSYEQEE